MQGPHQVAQKFTRTYFPLCWLRLTSSPLRDLRVKSGAGTVFSDCARAMGEKNNAHAKQKNNAIFFMKIIKASVPLDPTSNSSLSRVSSLLARNSYCPLGPAARWRLVVPLMDIRGIQVKLEKREIILRIQHNAPWGWLFLKLFQYPSSGS